MNYTNSNECPGAELLAQNPWMMLQIILSRSCKSSSTSLVYLNQTAIMRKRAGDQRKFLQCPNCWACPTLHSLNWSHCLNWLSHRSQLGTTGHITQLPLKGKSANPQGNHHNLDFTFITEGNMQQNQCIINPVFKIISITLSLSWPNYWEITITPILKIACHGKKLHPLHFTVISPHPISPQDLCLLKLFRIVLSGTSHFWGLHFP